MTCKRSLKIYEDLQEKYAEYLEMHQNPELFIAGVLIKEIINLQDYTKYLERRLDVEYKH